MPLGYSPSDFMFGVPYAPGLGSDYGAIGGYSSYSSPSAPSVASSPGIISLNPPTPPTDLTGLAPSAPAAGTAGASFFDKANLALAGLQTLGNLWGAFQSVRMAKRQFKFEKDITNTNLANQIQSYNTALADRARSRGVMEGQTPDQVSSYINANSLSRNSATPSGAPVSGITAAALSNYGNYVRPKPAL